MYVSTGVRVKGWNFPRRIFLFWGNVVLLYTVPNSSFDEGLAMAYGTIKLGESGCESRLLSLEDHLTVMECSCRRQYHSGTGMKLSSERRSVYGGKDHYNQFLLRICYYAI